MLSLSFYIIVAKLYLAIYCIDQKLVWNLISFLCFAFHAYFIVYIDFKSKLNHVPVKTWWQKFYYRITHPSHAFLPVEKRSLQYDIRDKLTKRVSPSNLSVRSASTHHALEGIPADFTSSSYDLRHKNIKVLTMYCITNGVRSHMFTIINHTKSCIKVERYDISKMLQ